MQPWMSPLDRYYYPWYATEPGVAPPPRRTDREIKSDVVDRLRENPFTKDHTLRVDVKEGVVVMQGSVASRVAKRSAGDDAWDIEGVADVSNQLQVVDKHSKDEPLDEVMTRAPITVAHDASIETAARLMHEHDIGFLIVASDEGTLAGVLTDRDIVSRGLAEGRPLSTPVEEICTKDVVTAPVDYRPGDLAATMVWSSIRRLPIVEDGRVLGVVSLGDLARHMDPGSALASISAAPANA